MKTAMVLLSLCVAAAATQAQTNFSIDRSVVAGGGGTSTGGAYHVSGTIGQHDAHNSMTNGPFSLTGGYWSVFAVQMPGAPQLQIRPVNNTTIAVWWPSPSTGFQLEESKSVRSTNWTSVTITPSDDGTNKTVVIQPDRGAHFYRLKKQP